MSLVPEDKEYADLYERAKALREPLFGRWKVEMLTGPLLVLNILGDYKIFKGDHGYNMTQCGAVWGEFYIGYAEYCTVLNYSKDKNPVFKKIVDYIRVTLDGSCIGKFFLGGRFLGYFTLTRA